MNDLLTVLWVGNLEEAQLGYLTSALFGFCSLALYHAFAVTWERRQKFPDIPVSLEENTEVPGTTSSETLLPS